MLVRHGANRFSEVDASLRRAERHMCQHLHETVIMVVHFDADSLLWRDFAAVMGQPSREQNPGRDEVTDRFR